MRSSGSPARTPRGSGSSPLAPGCGERAGRQEDRVMVDERIALLVTVKAYPEPDLPPNTPISVAGVRTDVDRPEWVRLFSVPVRRAGSVASVQEVSADRG